MRTPSDPPPLRSFVTMLVLAALLAPLGAQAEPGDYFGVSYPDAKPYVDFGDALHDEPVVRTIVVQSTADDARQVSYSFAGEPAAWFTLDAPNPFTLAARSERTINVTLLVPNDTAMGTYAGNLTFVRASPPASPSGSASLAIELGAVVNLRFLVTRAERPALTLSSIEVPDVVAGEPLSVSVAAANTGNVRAGFDVRTTLFDIEAGRPAGTFTNTSDPIPAGATRTLVFTSPFSPRTGQYVVNVTATARHGNTTLNVSRLLEVADSSAILAHGRLDGVMVLDPATHAPANWATVGHIVLVDGNFTNTGSIAVVSTLKCEAYRDGELVDVFESDARLVAAHETVALDAFFQKADVSGRYEIRAHASYAGKITETRTTILNVNPPRAAIGAGRTSFIPLPATVALLALCAAAALVSPRTGGSGRR